MTHLERRLFLIQEGRSRSLARRQSGCVIPPLRLVAARRQRFCQVYAQSVALTFLNNITRLSRWFAMKFLDFLKWAR